MEELKRLTIPILKRHGVRRAAFFGSIVKGEEAHDVDLVVEFEGERTLLDLVGLKLELEEALGRKVDVLTYRGLHPAFRERVLKEQVRIL